MAKDISNFSNDEIKALKRTPFLCESCYKKLGYPVWYDIDKEGFRVKDGIHGVAATIETIAYGIGGGAATTTATLISYLMGATFLGGSISFAYPCIGILLGGIFGGKKAFKKIKCKCASLCTSISPNDIAKYKYNPDKGP